MIAFLAAAVLSAATAPPVCFGPEDNRALRYAFIQQAPPPDRRASQSSAFYPASAYATANIDRLWTSAARPDRTYYFQWANRSNGLLLNARGALIRRKANPQPGTSGEHGLRTKFTTREKADACTLASAAYVLGQPEQAQALAAQAGIALSRLQPGVTGDASDACVVPARPAPTAIAGIVLDYEVQDGRTPEQALTFLQLYADLVHAAGKRVLLYSNPFDAPTQTYSGLRSPSSRRLVSMFDNVVIFLWSRARADSVRESYESQLRVLEQEGPVDRSKLLVLYELAGLTVEDARFLHDLILADHLAGAMLWRNGAAQGGACSSDVNRKIACLALGRC